MRKKILVIEDNQVNQIMIRKKFKPSLYNLRFINDEFDYVHEIKKFEPDIIILDLIMPKVNGLTIIRDIRSHNIDTKIIAYSNIKREYVAEHAYSLGANFYAEKPFRYNYLEEIVEEFL